VFGLQLLDCLSIPTVLILSCVILRVRYRWPHYLGVALCIVGIGSLIIADVMVERTAQQHSLFFHLFICFYLKSYGIVFVTFALCLFVYTDASLMSHV